MGCEEDRELDQNQGKGIPEVQWQFLLWSGNKWHRMYCCCYCPIIWLIPDKLTFFIHGAQRGRNNVGKSLLLTRGLCISHVGVTSRTVIAAPVNCGHQIEHQNIQEVFSPGNLRCSPGTSGHQWTHDPWECWAHCVLDSPLVFNIVEVACALLRPPLPLSWK